MWSEVKREEKGASGVWVGLDGIIDIGLVSRPMLEEDALHRQVC